MPRIVLTQKMLNRLILEFRSIINDPDYLPPDYSGAKSPREKWEMAVRHIKEALLGSDQDNGDVIVLERNKSYRGMTAAFAFSSKFAKYISEDYVRTVLKDAFGENNVYAEGPGSKPDFLSGKYKTWKIVLPDGSTFRAVFIIKVRAWTEHDSRGVPTYHGSGAEGNQINAMNAELRLAIGDSTDGIVIDLGGQRLENVGAVIKQSGTPKSDAFFAPMRDGRIVYNQPLAHVSLKDAKNPNDMNQWSGASKFANEPEIVDFVERLRSVLATNTNPNELPSGMSYRSAMPLSSRLARKMCWGFDWAPGRSGINAVDMIYVCPSASIELVPTGDAYIFEGDLVLYNGDIPPDGWQPFLWARRGDRNDFGILNCRIGAFPKEYRSGRFQII